MQNYIEIEGAREHNLKNVSLRLPHHALIVFTGVSGSGKSSLAFDTLHKEGQRRFIESLSPYARQFLGDLDKPKVERIDGISPTVCIDQKRRGASARSTVGTITAVYDYLRLLFARLGTPYCPNCKVEVTKQSTDQIARLVLSRYDGRNIYVLAPMILERKGEYRKELAQWQADGLLRVRVDGKIFRLDEEISLSRYEKHTLEIVLDRLTMSPAELTRLRDDIQHATKLANGVIAFATPEGESEMFSVHRACPHCGFSIPELEPRLFSFNSPEGQCPTCEGSGTMEEFDAALLIGDPERSLKAGALKCFNKDGNILFSQYGQSDIEETAAAQGVSLDRPWQELPQAFRELVLSGPSEEEKHRRRGAGYFPGILPILRRLYAKWHLHQLHRFLNFSPCSDCGGTRLRRESRHVLFRGFNVAQLCALRIGELQSFLHGTVLQPHERLIGDEIFHELHQRLSFLLELGLDYLTLDRHGNTLAGGEMQRIRLARQLGSGLQGVLYILDEPSIGLHARDNKKLLAALAGLRDMGNTVIVIEHDEETMLAADHIVDMGPGAGAEGGEVVAQGNLAEIRQVAASLTARYLNGQLEIPMPLKRRVPGVARLMVQGATQHNLRTGDVEFPLGLLIAVTGVSGSGKSTLVDDILYRAVARHLYNSTDIPGQHQGILGLDWVNKVVEVDQSAIGRNPRSNPATYTKLFDEIRELFCLLPDARTRGYEPGRFSFNVAGGRCERCEGLGYKEIEMQFLPSVWIPCEDCDGRRFNRETLEIHYREKSIADILEMTVAEAYTFFENHPKPRQSLQTMLAVGLSYIKLGQPSPTLSGGEAQRVKLVRELQSKGTGKSLYILDEPTTGLHIADIRNLLAALQQLVDQGNTVIVIEHNLEIIKVADWVIDLGPEGGAAGGKIVVAGTPETVMACPESHTGRSLLEYLAMRRSGTLVSPITPARPWTPRSAGRDIVIHGATKHNLKNVTVAIPWQQMTVVTGVSGSGKSSLVFDTLFAEGQRTFLESLSTYARRFLGRLDHGEVDAVEGLAPTISIDQKTASANPRSTVATMTEIHDYLRVLYARIGIPHCPQCDKPLCAYTPSSAAARVVSDFAGTVGLILAPLYLPNVKKEFALSTSAELKKYLPYLRDKGFGRLLVGGTLYRLEELPKSIPRKPIHLVLDRTTAEPGELSRIAEGFATAFAEGHGVAFFQPVEQSKLLPGVFCEVPACVACDYYQTDELHPRKFSFNHYLGACKTCDGLGFIRGEDEEVCPDCQGRRLKPEYLAVKLGGLSIAALCAQTISQVTQFFKEITLTANESKIATEAIKDVLNRLKFLADVGLEYLTLDRRGNTLSGGEAQRIRLATQIGNRLIGVIYVLDEPTVGLHARDTEQMIATLRNLVELGNTVVMVEHDPLCIRTSDHLIDMGPGAGHAGGEVIAAGTPNEVMANPQSLTGQYLAGSFKVKIPPATDAPQGHLTIRNACLHNLKNITVAFPLGQFSVVTGVSGSGKSSLVVEVLQRTLDAYLSHPDTNRIEFEVALPDGDDTVAPQSDMEQAESAKAEPAGQSDRQPKTQPYGCAGVTGIGSLQRMIVVDQTPLARSTHSNVATYCDLLTPIRELFASLPGSRARGFTPARFSFNRPGGRCEACEGQGMIEVQMHFLSDVWVTCEACHGKRFLEETLAVHYHDKNIADVLDMDVVQAKELFAAHSAVIRRLKILEEIGLGYIRLGQLTTHLSGGEAQRLKLAKELAASRSPHTLYLMDEPTTGLHPCDIQKLLEVIARLRRQGHTVIVIEHNLDVIGSADFVVDLGPEGGDRGGELVFAGTPRNLAKCKRSYTGQSLRNLKKA